MNTVKVRRPIYLLLCLFVLSFASGCMTLARVANRFSTDGNPPKAGLRIINVIPGGNGEYAGLQPMDLLSKYGDFEIVDDSTYFKAREFYANSRGSVRLEIWRGRTRLRPSVQAGRLDVLFIEYNPVMYQFHSIMQELDMRNEIPLYQREKEFKEAFGKSSESILSKAQAVIDQAERDHSITPTQVLASRIYLIPDDAPAEALKQQSQMLSQFLSTQPDGYIEYIGNDVFYKNKHYRPAVECFKQHLKVDPSNVSMWLNLGCAANLLGMYDQAQTATDYVEEHRLGLSDYGMIVLYQVKAGAALGHGHYAEAMSFADRVFEIHRKPYDISLVQLAAARAGDLKKLAEATSRYEKMLPGEFEQRRYQADAIEAYALVRLKQRERARQLVLKWRDGDRIESRVADYWRMYPEGAEVAKNWKELMKS